MSRSIRRALWSVFGAALLVLFSLPTYATLTGLDVTLSDPSVPLSFGDTITVMDGKEIFAGNPTNIGSATVGGSSLLLPNEFVDAQAQNRIVLGVEAGSGDLTGYGSGASYLFSNLKFDTPSIITDVAITLNNVDGVTKGSQVVFGPHSVRVFIDTLTIPQFEAGCISSAQCGTITLDLTVQSVPEPQPWALLSIGFCAIAAIVRLSGKRAS